MAKKKEDASEQGVILGTALVVFLVWQLLTWFAEDITGEIKFFIVIVVGIFALVLFIKLRNREIEKAEELLDSVARETLQAYKEQGIPARLKRKYLEKLIQERMSPDEATKKQLMKSIKERMEQLELQNVMEVQSEESNKGRKPIPSSVRDEVWRRDQGTCVKCGSRENLEFDHIVPVSKGGSNTARNIELLCEKCNRSKSAKIE